MTYLTFCIGIAFLNLTKAPLTACTRLLSLAFLLATTCGGLSLCGTCLYAFFFPFFSLNALFSIFHSYAHSIFNPDQCVFDSAVLNCSRIARIHLDQGGDFTYFFNFSAAFCFVVHDYMFMWRLVLICRRLPRAFHICPSRCSEYSL